jgi:hypothetical protein
MKDGVLFSRNFDQNRIMKKEIKKNGFSPNKHTHRPEKRKRAPSRIMATLLLS